MEYGICYNFNFDSQLVGRGWFRSFMKWYPELAKSKAQNMNLAQAQKSNKLILGDYFTKLREVLDTLNLKKPICKDL